MVKFELAKKSEDEILKKTMIISFSDASIKDFGVEGILPPNVENGKQIDSAFEEKIIYSIKDNENIVGGIIIELKEQNEYYLQAIWVLPDYQDKKIGSKALEFLETTHSDATSWMLETPMQAKRNRYFYEKHGYEQFDEKSFENTQVVLVYYRKQMR